MTSSDSAPGVQGRTRVAIIGSGISGMGAAYQLQKTLGQTAEIVVFEKDARLGGHTHTVDITLEGMTFGVDTGFLVYNERTYPKLIALFEELRVATAASDMSFSVKHERDGLEWNGSTLNTVFAQRSNLFRPGFWRLLKDLIRFNNLATELVRAGLDNTETSIGEFLDAQRFSQEFRDWYFIPMIACIWSCPSEQMLKFPMVTMLRFCDNHGLLQVNNRPRWFTVKGGARHYLDAIGAYLKDVRAATPAKRIRRSATGVHIQLGSGQEERFDYCIAACHPDETLALLESPTAREQGVLSAIKYQANVAVLHTDESLLPKRKLAWAAWNYEYGSARESKQVCLHYLINKLQPLPVKQAVVVSLNPLREPNPSTVIKRIEYAHPVFDGAAIQAQAQLESIQGTGGLFFAGAWTGYGFHEDGLRSGLQAADAVAQSLNGAIPAHQRWQPATEAAVPPDQLIAQRT